VTAPCVALTLADAEPNDLPAVTAIERSSFGDPWSERSFHALLSEPAATFRVARQAGRVLGFVVLYTAADEAELANLAVAPDARRQRVGEALLREVLEIARTRGAVDVWLEVRCSNAAARALYAKHGFTEVGTRTRYYRDPVEDAVIMRCDLTARPSQ
jgi:ribosomal-protein-alanine N-acetyltransferase